MAMSINLDVIYDSDNSYPPKLSISRDSDRIIILLQSPERAISIDVDDFQKISSILLGD